MIAWAVIPAAGSGSRMGGDRPKQYLPLAGKTVIEHVLDRFLAHPAISGIVVALADGDPWRERLARAGEPPVMTVTGGPERHHSVLNALHRLHMLAHPDDWVLVHDAARPCLRASDIDRLIDEVRDHPVGGLLGLPVADTLKRIDHNHEVIGTLNRDNVWYASTPQMFRLGELTAAIERAIREKAAITDEAGAIERTARMPRMVIGSADNIKITRPADLALAEQFLRQQALESAP
jgi:2-C-methyl-D-erythritol 4-phosphate cytidylyltransferase